jgi:flagellar protein FliL
MSSATQAAETKAAGSGRKGRGRAKLLALVVLLVAAGAGLWFSGVLPGLLGKGAKAKPAAEAAAQPPKPPTFVDMPELIANLNAGPRHNGFVKLKAKLELARPEDAAAVQAAMPRVVDLFQTYLREMRPEEFRGAAGTYRLREELLARVGAAVAPARVNDVLFVELLVQ